MTAPASDAGASSPMEIAQSTFLQSFGQTETSGALLEVR
jgi:hypothetical protein